MFHVLLGCCEFSTVYWELVNWNTTEYRVNHFSATNYLPRPNRNSEYLLGKVSLLLAAHQLTMAVDQFEQVLLLLFISCDGVVELLD